MCKLQTSWTQKERRKKLNRVNYIPYYLKQNLLETGYTLKVPKLIGGENIFIFYIIQN